MPGTNVWSVVFTVAAAIIMVLLIAPMVNMWRRYVRNADKAIEKGVEPPSWTGPAVMTIAAIGIYALAVTLGWNAMTNTTTSTEVRQKNPAAVQEQKKVQESQVPSSKELNKARTEQKDVQQVKPHKEALDSFDESMKREAEKIRQRSLNEPASPEKK
jgi:hypothetical protein